MEVIYDYCSYVSSFVLLQLARRGMKVALISRSKEKLDQVASEISELKTSSLNFTGMFVNKWNCT